MAASRVTVSTTTTSVLQTQVSFRHFSFLVYAKARVVPGTYAIATTYSRSISPQSNDNVECFNFGK